MFPRVQHNCGARSWQSRGTPQGLTFAAVGVNLRVLTKRHKGDSQMKEYQSLAHTSWDCKYHVVFIPKNRKKKIFGVLRKHLGEILRELAKHKEAEVLEGHLMSDHVHICYQLF